MELMLTLGLVSTILGTASESQNIGGLSAIGVGGYIVLAGLWSSPISGASMNPVRSLAPALVLQDFGSLWILSRRPARRSPDRRGVRLPPPGWNKARGPSRKAAQGS